MGRKKIAVYTIAKNEEAFVERWYNSSKEADYHFILDTGSTDGTVELAKSLGIAVEVKTFIPWRFDFARNYSLSCLPEDINYCIALDMDEVLVEGWRDALDSLPGMVNRPRYKYVWSWDNNGNEGLVYGGDKIHSRHGYRWKHPVHEVLVPTGYQTSGWTDLEIHHHPDSTKSRSSYLPLLKLAVEEDKEDSRNSFYYARELFFYNQKEEAIREFNRALSLETSTWAPERARALRYLYELTGGVKYLWEAVVECPDRREGWVSLAKHYYNCEDWTTVAYAAEKALQIKEKPLEYLNEEFAWGYLPYDYAAISNYYLKNYEKAYGYGKMALELAPNDERLIKNMEWYENKIYL
jgi:tetratricopeptide (TPR) repeat protein